MSDGTANALREIGRQNPHLVMAMKIAADEIERLRAAGSDLVEWCRHERQLLGAIDGYDYDSGQEYGLRRAEIEIEKRLRALGSDSEHCPPEQHCTCEFHPEVDWIAEHDPRCPVHGSDSVRFGDGPK